MVKLIKNRRTISALWEDGLALIWPFLQSLIKQRQKMVRMLNERKLIVKRYVLIRSWKGISSVKCLIGCPCLHIWAGVIRPRVLTLAKGSSNLLQVMGWAGPFEWIQWVIALPSSVRGGSITGLIKRGRPQIIVPMTWLAETLVFELQAT